LLVIESKQIFSAINLYLRDFGPLENNSGHKFYTHDNHLRMSLFDITVDVSRESHRFTSYEEERRKYKS
jgi:hypothetical protein